MMSEDTPEEQQKNEFEALQAIFIDSVVDKREPTAWKMFRPNDFCLTLYPMHNSNVKEVHCSITLHIKCCHNYPDKPPSIEINKSQGLSKENSETLLSELITLATEKCGEVMIYELAQHAQQFLHDHNKPTLSFYDEMVKQNNEKEKLKLYDLLIKEKEERQKIKDEIQKRQEMLRSAGRQHSKFHGSNTSQENSVDGPNDVTELVYYADDKMSPAKKVVRRRQNHTACNCNLKSVQTVRITQKNNKKVYIGNCVGHSSNGATTFLAIEESGEPLITKKWSIPAASDFQLRNRQMTSLQQDLKSMCRLENQNLVPYTAIESIDTKKSGNQTSVYIFRNFILGSSLKYLLDQWRNNDKFEALKLLRHVGCGVFSALTELHSVNIVHKDVRCENVYLDECGTVKLVGASLDLWLFDIQEGDSYCDRQTQAQDIYAAAQMLLAIVTRERTTHEIPSELPSAAKDFFSRCMTEDEHSQWSAEQLRNHGFLVDIPTKQPEGKLKDDCGSCSEDEDAVKKIQHIGPAMNGHSRLNAEFEVLTWLGQGAFGDVLKVKNKLDGGFYAIKRIKLNPKSVQLNKKITREVKLLSRLNHENVVRYFNAWIESTTEVEDEEDSSISSISKTPTRKKPGDRLEDVVEKLIPYKLEWSIRDGTQTRNTSSDSEDDDDDEQPLSSAEDESSGNIEFEQNDVEESLTIPSEAVPDTPIQPSIRLNQVLYIQMEFCEKHTLRQAIDNSLCQEHYRAWRLFREIVEGLAHVHQRGMIHRDLKPVNIFLDSNDHVKIGDFGLATKAFTALAIDEKAKPEDIGGSLTGQVGTALYVAPELLQTGTKGIYNQKVDLYSLGVILFEMFHPPLSTGMERMKVLNNLRTKDIIMPNDFVVDDNIKQIKVIRWLLNHDASTRPTCAELLSSEHIPRPVHEGTLAGLLSHTLSERGSRNYQRLVAACLDQRASAAEDYTYHNDMKTKANEILASVKDIVIKVFRSHGANDFAPPLLLPRAKGWEQHPNAVKVMTASGTVCHLPHDLRLPFARHTAYSGTKYMRRYVVDRVYREKHVQGFHPSEIVECAFDIVTPKTDSLWPDAELLVVASRAASECSLKVTIQLNHTELLQTLLLSCGVPIDKHRDIYPVLVDVSFGRITRLQLQTHLTSLCITNRDVSNLLRLMEADVPVHEVRDLIPDKLKNSKWSRVITQSMHDLQALYRNAMALGCECPMTVAPFLAYNATQHSGVFWQMSVVRQADQKPNAKRRAGDLIAAGGRYDALVQEFWEVARTEKDHNAELKTCSVGFSMSLERMAIILKKNEIDLPNIVGGVEQSTLICVCVWGTAGSGRDGQAANKRAQLARELWASGLACCAWPQANGDAHELSKARVVLWQDDAHIRVACWGDRVIEYKLPYHEVIDFVKQKLNPDIVRTPDGSNNRSICWGESEKANSPNISVTFITAHDRITKNSKRLLENQINTQVTSILVSLGLQAVLSRVRVIVIALSCEGACVRLLAAQLTTPLDVTELPRAFQLVCDTYIKRQNILEDTLKELTSIAKQNNQNRSTDESQLYALYSIPDSVCRLIT